MGKKGDISRVSVVCVFYVWTHLVKAEAAERCLLWQEVAKSRRAADVGRVGGVALHKTGGTQERCFLGSYLG